MAETGVDTADTADPLAPGGLLEPELSAAVAAALRRPRVNVTGAGADSIIPPGANMTTGGLWRVTGTARSSPAGADPLGTADVPFSIIAKLTQSPLLWPGIHAVPEEFRQQLADRYLWRTEAQVYAAGVGAALPFNARMPEAFRIVDLDGQRKLIWMEDVGAAGVRSWTDEDYVEAAYVLGGLAGSPAVDACVETVADATDIRRMRFFLEGVGAQLLIPAIRSDDVWQHPAVAAAADADVISGLRSIADRSWDLMEGLAALRQFPVHGDASPQNLLSDGADHGSGGFVMIDWGTYGRGPAGFDLAQLLAGRVNSGDMAGTELSRLTLLCVEAYCSGMADAGTEPDPAEVSRGHAATMAIFSGLFALPLDQLAGPSGPELEGLVAARLDMVRYIVQRIGQVGL